MRPIGATDRLARSLVAFGEATFGELSLTDCAAALAESGKSLNDGDLSGAINMLSSQAAALNAVFGELARRSALNMGQYIDASERYMRLALRAQGQCRATLETLAAIKNPPLVFARQANINNGGQQQVNNGAPAAAPAAPEAPSHAEQNGSLQSKLLESSDGEWLDTGATGTASRTHQDLAPVGALDGA